jgi:hypothetical protein
LIHAFGFYSQQRSCRRTAGVEATEAEAEAEAESTGLSVETGVTVTVVVGSVNVAAPFFPLTPGMAVPSTVVVIVLN